MSTTGGQVASPELRAPTSATSSPTPRTTGSGGSTSRSSSATAARSSCTTRRPTIRTGAPTSSGSTSSPGSPARRSRRRSRFPPARGRCSTSRARTASSRWRSAGATTALIGDGRRPARERGDRSRDRASRTACPSGCGTSRATCSRSISAARTTVRWRSTSSTTCRREQAQDAVPADRRGAAAGRAAVRPRPVRPPARQRARQRQLPRAVLPPHLRAPTRTRREEVSDWLADSGFGPARVKTLPQLPGPRRCCAPSGSRAEPLSQRHLAVKILGSAACRSWITELARPRGRGCAP